jgi:hypothetical protein
MRPVMESQSHHCVVKGWFIRESKKIIYLPA